MSRIFVINNTSFLQNGHLFSLAKRSAHRSQKPLCPQIDRMYAPSWVPNVEAMVNLKKLLTVRGWVGGRAGGLFYKVCGNVCPVFNMAANIVIKPMVLLY